MSLFQISMEHIFVISLLSGFLYSLLLYISGGKLRFFFRMLSRFRFGRFGRKTIFGGKDFAPPWLMPIVIGTYLIGFGLNGLILRVLFHLPSKESFIAAQVSSIAISTVVLVIAKKFLSDSAAELKGVALYGMVAHVSLAIPESGIGAIAYVQEGKRVTMPARSRTGSSITKGSQVVIVDLQTRVALVEEL
jgi:hypothetical protein